METTQDQPRTIEPLACRREEACRLLGGISTVSLWRMEKAGLIRPVPGIRHKLYSLQSLRDFVAGKGAS